MPKAMIVTVGGTPEPIIKSILEYKPDFVSGLQVIRVDDLPSFPKMEIF